MKICNPAIPIRKRTASSISLSGSSMFGFCKKNVKIPSVSHEADIRKLFAFIVLV